MTENWELWLFVLIDDIQYGNVSGDWMVVQFRAIFSPSTSYWVFFCEAIPFLILDSTDFFNFFQL